MPFRLLFVGDVVGVPVRRRRRRDEPDPLRRCRERSEQREWLDAARPGAAPDLPDERGLGLDFAFRSRLLDPG